LWYKIAQANGLAGAGQLAAGTSLTLPSGITRSSFNAGTATPYNAGEAIGDTSPTTAKPPKKNKCGVFGQILLAAISIAVSFILPAAAPGVFGGFWGGVGAAAVGSVVSQGVGVATGIQQKFSFKGVALAALSAGVGAGVGDVIKGGVLGSKFLGDVVRGAVSSAVTQGVAVATGLQSKFDFVGVAAAGIGAGVGGALARELPGQAIERTATTAAKRASFLNSAGSSMADAIASAATRSALTGSNFGDNLIQAVPSAIGNALGRALGQELADDISEGRVNRLLAHRDTPQELRDDPNVRGYLMEVLATGATNRQIRGMIGDGSVGSALAWRAAAGATYFSEESQSSSDGDIVVIGAARRDDYEMRLAVYRPDDRAVRFSMVNLRSRQDILGPSILERLPPHPPRNGSWTTEQRDRIFDDSELLWRSIQNDPETLAVYMQQLANLTNSSRQMLDLYSLNEDFLSINEGGLRLKAYGLRIDSSGITIGYGFDIGQHRWQDMRALNFPPMLIYWLAPFSGNNGNAFTWRDTPGDRAIAFLDTHERHILPEEAEAMRVATKAHFIQATASTYNSAARTAQGDNFTPFRRLTSAQQSVLVDIAYQWGTINRRDDGGRARVGPIFDMSTAGNWTGVQRYLARGGTGYRSRDLERAGLLAGTWRRR
jgi:hypothetical protein